MDAEGSDEAVTLQASAGSVAAQDADEAGCRLYDFVVCTVIIGLVCLFGLAGNVTSFFVLLKHKSETATIFLLQSMAVFDSLLLLVSLFIYTLPFIYPYTGRLQVRECHFTRNHTPAKANKRPYVFKVSDCKSSF